MSVSTIDPEDFGLVGNAVSSQNAAVLAAQARVEEMEKQDKERKDREDEIALEKIAKAYKGRPLPEDWDPDSHPLFTSNVEETRKLDNVLVEGIKALEKDDTPDEIAERYKRKGNDALKRGPKFYDEAIGYYTQALQAKCNIAENNSIYLSNRAAVQLLKKNYGKVIEDCEEAIKLQPSNVKAYFRAARACNGLHKYARAVEFCDEGLKREEGSTELGKERAIAQEGLKRREDEAKRKQAQEAKQLLAESGKARALRKACEQRGIVMGAKMFEGISGRQGADAYVDGEGKIHWPVLLLYDEFDQSDFIQDVHEDSAIAEQLAVVFDPAQPPPDWDPARRYGLDSIAVYFATHQTRPLEDGMKKGGALGGGTDSDESFIASLLGGTENKGREKEIQRAEKAEWVRVGLGDPLADVVRAEGHVVPGLVVLHVVQANSVFERHLLSTPPDRV